MIDFELDAACAQAMGWKHGLPAFIDVLLDPSPEPETRGMQHRGDGDAFEFDMLRRYSTDAATRPELLAWLKDHGCLQLSVAQESLASLVVEIAESERESYVRSNRPLLREENQDLDLDVAFAIVMAARGPAGIHSRKGAATAMIKALARTFTLRSFDPNAAFLLDWSAQLMKFHQFIKTLRDIFSTPEDRRDAALRRDFANFTPTQLATFLHQADMGQQLVEECFRDIGGDVKQAEA